MFLGFCSLCRHLAQDLIHLHCAKRQILASNLLPSLTCITAPGLIHLRYSFFYTEPCSKAFQKYSRIFPSPFWISTATLLHTLCVQRVERERLTHWPPLASDFWEGPASVDQEIRGRSRVRWANLSPPRAPNLQSLPGLRTSFSSSSAPVRQPSLSTEPSLSLMGGKCCIISPLPERGAFSTSLLPPTGSALALVAARILFPWLSK